ncbi:MAG: formylglycine-generating enzyme family protein, partial [Burkholderiales bacterium]
DARLYPWGNEAPDGRRARFGAGWHDTAPVDAHPAGASPYGVLDMAGNAWEWVSSVYRPYPYRLDDGREDLSPGPVRVTRGGGQDSSSAEITTTQRGRNLSRNPAAGHHNIGFRCAR